MQLNSPSKCMAAALLLLSCGELCSCYRALFLAPVGSKSHKNFFMGVAQALTDEGNQVTMVTPYAPSKPSPNIKEVVLRDADLSLFFPNAFAGNSLFAPLTVMRKSFGVCLETLGSPEAQGLREMEFDVVLLSLFFSDCYLSLVHQLKVPFVYVSPMGLIGPSVEAGGNPAFPSFTVSPVFTFQHPLSFGQRALSAVLEAFGSVTFKYLMGIGMDVMCRQNGMCPDDMPHVNTMKQNSSLVIINGVKALETPVRPYVPAVIHAGGIHCKPAKPLPKDLQQWVDEAGDDGFIFFSLGSAVKPSDMPEEYRRILVKVFGSLPQRVLWKWDSDSMEDLPPNVRLGKWLPQQDILGNPKLRLFITHGGLLSTLESTYHATPVLGVPVFGDQIGNMVEVERQGWGRTLLWGHFDEIILKETILNIIGNEKMLAEVKKRSAIMRDVPTTPAQNVAYWVGYVVRHSGAPHLRSPILDMRWYEVYNTDVWTVLALSSCCIVYLVFRLFSFCCRRSRKQKKE